MDPEFICQKCGTLLTPGRGDFYVVNIEAYAEDSPPVITAEDLSRDHAEEMRRIVKELEALSPQEAMDSVHRQMSFFLCRPCYRKWIENPVGE
jgi:RNase P subunit RPR2